MVITLTTDFGHTDAFVGTMKGVILSICPSVQIVDICHDLPPQDIVSGALLLSDSYRYFPKQTIHVAVVDPGVGSLRATLAVRTERYVFVAPDNGLLDVALRNEKLIRIVQLNNPDYHLQPVSATFHGRDIFAPAAAHIAAGVDIQRLGDPVDAWKPLSLPCPERKGDALEIHVLRADRFGNAITDLTLGEFQAWNPSGSPVLIKTEKMEIHGIRRTFSDASANEPVAYFGSGGRLEIAVNGARAVDLLHLVPNGSILLVLRA